MKLTKLKILFLSGVVALLAGVLLLRYWNKLYQDKKNEENLNEDFEEDLSFDPGEDPDKDLPQDPEEKEKVIQDDKEN